MSDGAIGARDLIGRPPIGDREVALLTAAYTAETALNSSFFTAALKHCGEAAHMIAGDTGPMVVAVARIAVAMERVAAAGERIATALEKQHK